LALRQIPKPKTQNPNPNPEVRNPKLRSGFDFWFLIWDLGFTYDFEAKVGNAAASADRFVTQAYTELKRTSATR